MAVNDDLSIRTDAPVHSGKVRSVYWLTAADSERLIASRGYDVAPDAPLDMLGPLGCGIQTGAGAILNSLNVAHGSKVAIFGAGAVGLSAVMAAAAAGAAQIVAVDVVPSL